MHIARSFVALVAVVGITVGATLVAAGQTGPADPAVAEGTSPQTGQAPNARLQTHVIGSATLGLVGFTPGRTKGLQAVRNPVNGVFCIKPKAATNIVPARVVPVLVTDAEQSADQVIATWAADRPFCAGGRIEVHGTNVVTGALSNEVAFGIVVN